MKRTIFISIMLLFAASFGFAEEEVQEVAVIAQRWEFFPSTITVKKDIPVNFQLTSVDVPHGFSFSELDTASDKLENGEIVTLSYTFTDVGEFTFTCIVYCGSGHRNMKGKIIVEE